MKDDKAEPNEPRETSQEAVAIFNEFLCKLQPLSEEDRRRVLQATCVFFGVER